MRPPPTVPTTLSAMSQACDATAATSHSPLITCATCQGRVRNNAATAVMLHQDVLWLPVAHVADHPRLHLYCMWPAEWVSK